MDRRGFFAGLLGCLGLGCGLPRAKPAELPTMASKPWRTRWKKKLRPPANVNGWEVTVSYGLPNGEMGLFQVEECHAIPKCETASVHVRKAP